MLGQAPNVSMTTRQICIAAKGIVNSLNNPALGGDINNDTDYYTVISHPDAAPKPQPPVTITKSGGNATIAWLADAGLFVLQATPAVSPTAWSDVSPQPAVVRVGAGDANDQYQMTVSLGAGNLYYRLLRRW
jgi:hypothetical protein